MKKYIAALFIALFSLYGAATFIAKGWYYLKVIRTVERILRAQQVPFTF